MPGNPSGARRVIRSGKRGSTTTLSWRGRLAWSLLPFVPLAIFIWGGLGLFNPMLWVVAGITAIATALWLPHVWTRTVITPEHAALPDLSATAAHTSTVDPADHFAWITSESGIAQSDAENAR